MKRFVIKLVLCILPLSLTPVLGYLLAEGYLNLGSGCKDIFLVVPWFVWSVLYCAIFVVLWVKGRPLRKLALYSLVGATLIPAVIWLVLLAPGLLILGT